MSSVFVIAEAGVNHNGDMGLAHDLIDVAADAGANAVKFQSFRADSLVSLSAEKAEYQKLSTDRSESQHDMIRKLELSEADHRTLFDYCSKRQIQFLSTPFDLMSLNFLTTSLNLPTIKMASGEITNGPLLHATAATGADIILSTGMSTMDEIAAALDVIAEGYEVFGRSPETRLDDTSYRGLINRVTLLHCTTEYPAPFSETNLNAMKSMREHFGLMTGFSDHTAGISICLAAVAMGACTVEKHITLDCSLPGPDHAASLEPDHLNELVKGIRNIELAMGDGNKVPRASELKNIPVARKSLVAIKPINKGELFTKDNLGCKRPGIGVSPMAYWTYLNQPADQDYAIDEAINP